MYKVKYDKEYRMPLQVPDFQERYKKLLTSKKKIVVYIKNEFDNSTFRYRCYNFVDALKNNNEYEITYFSCDEIPSIISYANKASMIVFQRTTWDVNVANLIHVAKANKMPCVYDMDDLIYKIDYVPSFVKHVDLALDDKTIKFYLGIAAGYEMVAKDCDSFITTTPYLKNMLVKDYNKDTYVVHNFLNNEQISESSNILSQREYDDNKIIVGYFSGSPSHRNDFRIVEKSLIELMKKYDNLYVKIVGFMKFDEEMNEFIKNGRVIIKELVPYQRLQYEIGEVDINIVPLVNSTFNECKSELKFFEAGIVKVPSCITHTELYDEIIQDGENGLLCNDGEWFDKLEKLILDKELRDRLAENAYQTVCDIYLPNKQTENIKNMYDKILNK